MACEAVGEEIKIKIAIAKSLKKTGIGNAPKNELASHLIDCGADPTIKNNEGLTPIDIALQNTKKFKYRKKYWYNKDSF